MQRKRKLKRATPCSSISDEQHARPRASIRSCNHGAHHGRGSCVRCFGIAAERAPALLRHASRRPAARIERRSDGDGARGCVNTEERQVHRALLERSALLHDVGRRKGDLDIWGKVACVLLVHYFPKRSKQWAEDGMSTMLHVYYHHPQIGAKLLRGIGLFEEADIIERHHAPADVHDSMELRLLREADEAN